MMIVQKQPTAGRAEPTRGNDACPVCDSRETRSHQFTLDAEGTCPIRRCERCTFLYVAGRDADAVRHGAEYHARREELVLSDDAVPVVDGFLRYWSRRLGWTRETRILEVGCADGALLRRAREMGLHVMGIDVTDYYETRWAAEGLPARVATPEAIADEGGAPFDAIVSRQVIEHVREPVPFLAACRRLLRAGGACLLETSDPDAFQARLLGRRWAYWVPGEGIGAHVSFFSRRAAAALGTRTGFELVDAVPHFRYRRLADYARAQRSAPWAPVTVAKYVFHRTALTSGRTYRFLAA